MRQNLLNDVNTLIAQKSSDFKDIDLEELKSRTQEILVLISDGEPFVGSGYRNGAVNFTERKGILYNFQKIKNYSATQKNLIQWHEAFGAMGYDDDNYLLSIIIEKKLSAPKVVIHPEIQKRLTNQFNEPKLSQDKTWKMAAGDSGGASGVGGGGDGEMAEIKWAILTYIEMLAANHDLGTPDEIAKLVDLAIDTPVESIEFKSSYQGLIEFNRVTIGINRFNAKITLLADSTSWQPTDSTQGVVSEKNTELVLQMVLVLQTLLK